MKEAFKSAEYKEINPEWTREIIESFHKSVNNIDGANSWYDTSCDEHEYETCEGDQNLNWKDKGSVTVFNLLQVCKPV